MRKLRVVFTTGGAFPALVATMLVSTVDGCGSGTGDFTGSDAAADAPTDTSGPSFDAADPPYLPPPEVTNYCKQYGATHIVELPPPGTPAEPGQICAVSEPTAKSNTAARITLDSFSPANKTARGFIAVPPSIVGIVEPPTVSVVSASSPELLAMKVTDIVEVAGGYQFLAGWADMPYASLGDEMVVKASFAIACDDGGTKTVESITRMDLCSYDYDHREWVSSGDSCTICQVIAEMAPSPIVSDNSGDDLPLGSVLRLRVVEVARAGRQVLLFAETDAGANTRYEWRISGGTLERVADDVMLWTLPDEDGHAPFGQVAVWNDSGAAVENFLSDVLWEAA
ncbi:hypothetical protein AKJ09_00301 [Labilithrix luteola]|uniref:PASTA domain-containing protein n=1 Tax=Labilithrix luteola TaxID=1391654 RepID=A0A0K1PJD8_9BACT|nr:hypothetical protein [Labilithrix luteola]AKU93637.1 hypothetical protein AKJ09_00301 [Labilithrix luteola]